MAGVAGAVPGGAGTSEGAPAGTSDGTSAGTSAGASAGTSEGAPARARKMRLVLDTNVWLDWLVFDDPSLAQLRAAHAAGRVEIAMDDACEAELARVLAYDLGRHTLDADAQARCLERCRRLAQRMASPSASVASAPKGEAIGDCGCAAAADGTAPAELPRCSDPHDQKFLELALAAGADALVTKDRALLDLARRKPPFRIAEPQALGFP
jgi:predicted nucleic acid-binding protein